MLDGISLFRLHVFTTVADEGGYAAAARHLNLAQPTVTFHIQALERIYRARLIEVHQRRVSLTPQGQVVYRTAQVMVRDARELERTLDGMAQGQAGQLRVGASMAFEVPAFFERVLTPFRQAHPDVRLVSQFGHSIRLAEAVRQRSLDVAYVLNWHIPDGVYHEPLHEADFVFVVGPNHPLARRAVVTPAEVAEAGIIAAPIDSQEWFNYGVLLRAVGVDQPRISAEIEGFQARVLAAHAGWGVLGMFVPPFAGDRSLVPLHQLDLQMAAPKGRFSLVCEAQPANWTPLLASFVDWLRRVTRPIGAFPT